MTEEPLALARQKLAQATVALEALERKTGNYDVAVKLLGDLRDTISYGIAHLPPNDVVGRQRFRQLDDECSAMSAAAERAHKRILQAATMLEEREMLARHANEKKEGPERISQQLLDEEKSLKYTRSRVHAMTEESSAVLGALRGQRQTLERSHDRLGGIIESVGLSRETIRQIFQRNKVDGLIVVVGVALLVFVMYTLW